MNSRYATFREFWPFYVSQHFHPVSRLLHFVGTALVIACVIGAITISPRWLAVAPIAGYGFAWVGHFVFEKNRPATFTYPAWSLVGDFKMFFCILSGRMEPELERARQLFGQSPADFSRS